MEVTDAGIHFVKGQDGFRQETEQQLVRFIGAQSVRQHLGEEKQDAALVGVEHGVMQRMETFHLLDHLQLLRVPQVGLYLHEGKGLQHGIGPSAMFPSRAIEKERRPPHLPGVERQQRHIVPDFLVAQYDSFRLDVHVSPPVIIIGSP